MTKLSTLLLEIQDKEAFKEGDPVLYLGKKGIITKVNHNIGGPILYNVEYKADNGSTTKAAQVPPSTLRKDIVHEENTPQEDGQEQWLQDELLPFLTQLPQARSIKNPQQLFTVFVQKLETHPTAMDMTPEAREDMAKLALQQLGLVKDVEQLPFEETMKKFTSSDEELPTHFNPKKLDQVLILWTALKTDGAQLSRYPTWVWKCLEAKNYINHISDPDVRDNPKYFDNVDDENLVQFSDEGLRTLQNVDKFQQYLKYEMNQLPSNPPRMQESTKVNMKLKQLIKEASEKGKAPEKGNKAIDSSSGLEKAKETTLNIDGENAGVIKHTDDMSDKVKGKIESLIKKHASSVKWEKDEMYWHFEMKDKIVARTRLTGLDWYEKPQELIDLENELRTLYNGFIGKITWNEAGEVCIPLKNVILSESLIRENLDATTSAHGPYQHEVTYDTLLGMRGVKRSIFFKTSQEAQDYVKNGAGKNKEYVGQVKEASDPNNPITNPMRTPSAKPASYDPKSALERVAQDIWKEPNVAKAKQAFTDFLATTKINDNSKKVMLTALQSINNKQGLDRYVANALLKFEKMGMNQLAKGPMAECDCEGDDIMEIKNFRLSSQFSKS